MATTGIQTELDKIAKAFENLSTQFKGGLPCGTPAASGDVFETSFEKIKKSTGLLAGWRRILSQHAPQITPVVSGKLKDLAAAGQGPDVSDSDFNDAFRKGAAIPFDSAILNDFAGYSQGPGPTGASVFKMWDEVIEEAHWRLQKATQSAKESVRPKDIGKHTDADYQLNAWSRESGLVAYHTTTIGGTQQKILFAGYPLGHKRILWVGQEVDDSLQPQSKDTFIICVNWKTEIQGQPAFSLVFFSVSIDQRGYTKVAAFPALVGVFTADSPKFDLLRERIIYFQKDLFQAWRGHFSGADPKLGDAIAEAFQDEQKEASRRVFRTAPMSGPELNRAFKDAAGVDQFQLADLNQFAGKWKATIYLYPDGRPPATFGEYLSWLKFTQGERGFYQRVVGSDASIADPLRLSGDEQGLHNLVLDAYLPECGLVSWLFGYSPDPAKAESAVMAVKLAANRTLWVAQFFTTKAVEDAKSAGGYLPKSDVYNLTLEWIVPYDGRKYRYLVSQTFTIDFAAGTVKPVKAEPIVKMSSHTI